MIEQQDWIDALKRIALTEDGWLLYCGFHKVAISLPNEADPSDGALRRDLGRRSLAREVMVIMAEGIDERGRRTGIDALSERPVAFAQPKPVPASRGSRGAGRRITDDTRVAGWDTDPDSAA